MGTLTPRNEKSPSVEVNKNPKRQGKWRKRICILMSGLIIILLISHLFWHYSGTNQWELAIDEKGVKVWTIKTPGSNLIRIKATVKIKSSLSGMVKLLEDLESCVDAQCYDAKVLKPVDSLPGHYAAFVRFKYDIPGFSTRDYVLYQTHVQNPQSKQLVIDIIAAPDAIPRDECCVRITHLHNNWKITPLANNELDIEFRQDTDIGGLPYILANYALKQGTYEILQGMQGLMDMEKYRTAKVNDIQEFSTVD